MPARQESCCFTGHRPAKLPWGYNEQDPRCVKLKERIVKEVGVAWRRDAASPLVDAAVQFAREWVK